MSTELTVLLVAAAVLVVATLTVAVLLLVRLVRTRRDLRRAGLPVDRQWVFWGAIAYLVLPADLLPDPIFLDDIGVLLVALKSMRTAGTAATRSASDGPAAPGRR
ncbi:DUF1232 domain-containing protein [Streptomyces flavofungini]|uniref:DUF1232 domain-containing protein n=1 Tax=Streptomyces flavofungini TaxID=68200 RepID=UPI0034DFC806